MGNMLNALKNATNITYTENGGLTHKTTRSDLLDMFAMGAAMRRRSEDDIILMFKKAYTENPEYAMKMLFYFRDVRGGQGERRFFRTVMHWLADNYTDSARKNIQYVAEYGRWDDLYCFVKTSLEAEMFNFIKHQFALDLECKTPSLLAKWLKSENASSKETAWLGFKTRAALGLTARQYRKMLSMLRGRIKIVETLMSQNRWDEIEFDKIPSKAGLIYKNAFARHDITKAKYEKFVKDETTKVNAKTLYPYEVVNEVYKLMRGTDWWARMQNIPLDDINRLAINKYWDNLADYFNDATFNGLCMIDTSGSMTGVEASAPINVAVSLGLYCAERAKGPFANHYISFSSRPQLIECEGVDFCDKVKRIISTNLCENTNIEAAFDLLLETASTNQMTQDDMPQNIIIISDMEFDAATANYGWRRDSDRSHITTANADTVMESIEKKWNAAGYKLPHLIFWNVDARQANIPMIGNGYVSYVSGFSPSIFDAILTGKTGWDLMLAKIDTERYANIHA